MGIKIALVGNPNSGKTTMYNCLTGSNQTVGNWPGVTIEKKEALLKGHKNAVLTDLPGIYSLSPYSPEEVITRDYLLNDSVDVIINIVDATNIERNLYLTTQVLEIDKPVIIALNFCDVIEKRGDKIDVGVMSKELGCPVIVTSATKKTGLQELSDLAVSLAGSRRVGMKFGYKLPLVHAIEKVKELLPVSQFEAIHLLDQDILLTKKFNTEANVKFKEIISLLEEKMQTDSQSAIVEERYGIVEKVVKKSVEKGVSSSTSERIDRIVTNRFLAFPIFILVMFLVYYVSIVSIGDLTIGWMETLFGEVIGENLRTLLQNLEVAPWLVSLLVDGIIGGVGSVLVFIPQLVILFIFLSLLEDLGYMSRVAFIMDRLFRRFGLSGKSFIPMLIGTGCSVPGIMATRTIENDQDRRMTILLTPFVPCGAKLPVFALFIGVFFFEGIQGPLASVSMYLLGMTMVVVCGIVLKKTKYFKGEASSFVMELPEYRLPSGKSLLAHIWERVKSFVVKAGTIIFVACVVIWFLQSFSWSMQMVEAEASIMASIGRVIAPIFAPLGFGNWQSSVAIMTGVIAKENVVATFGILFGGQDVNGAILNHFTPLSAYSFMAFILLSAPCLAAIGATRREMGTWKRTLATIAFQTSVAYVVALLIYQVGSLVINHKGSAATIAIGLVVLFVVGLSIVRMIKKKGCHSSCGGCSAICDKSKE